MKVDGLPILQAKAGDMDITKQCEKCRREVHDTPIDQIVICPSCGRFYYVQYPLDLFENDFFTFEKQLYISTIIEYLTQINFPKNESVNQLPDTVVPDTCPLPAYKE